MPSLFGIPEYYIILLGMMAGSSRPPYSKKVLVAVATFCSVKVAYQICKLRGQLEAMRNEEWDNCSRNDPVVERKGFS